MQISRIYPSQPEDGMGLRAFARQFRRFLELCAVLLPVGSIGAADTQAVYGHVPEVVAKGLAATGRVPGNRPMQLAVGLPLRNQALLAQTIHDLYDPHSPAFRKFLTPQEFTARFGPTEKDYLAVRQYVESKGLLVTKSFTNRMLLDVQGSAAAVEKAFAVNLRVYPHPTEARDFFAPDAEPKITVGVPILNIAGLSDYALPHSSSLHVRPADFRPNAGSDGGQYVGLDFRAAYVPGVTLNGAGQSVALLEFDTYYPGDITNYLGLNGAGLSGASVNVVPIGVDENTNTVPGADNAEVALDIDMVIAMAPGLANVYVYEAPNTSSSPDDVLTEMAGDNLARQISSSWSGFTDGIIRQAFQEFAAQGQTFFIAAGDSGAFVNPQNPVVPPVDDPLVTSVGGTTLSTTGPQGGWSGETTWNWFSTDTGTNAGSGGISTSFGLPTWQQGINMGANMGSTSFRNLPDVAMVADQIFIYDNNGSGQQIGGTSAAAPLWAGFMALVNQQNAAVGNPPQGYFNPTLYALAEGTNYAACFHDITTGNNTNLASSSAFFATAGYDLCTGWGTPVGSNLISLLAAPLNLIGITPLTGFSVAAALGGTIAPASLDFTLTNGSTNALSWTSSDPVPWLAVSPASGTIPAGGSTIVTVSLDTNVASGMAVGTYSTNIAFTDVTDGVTQARSFTLDLVGQQVVQNGGFETGDFTFWKLHGGGGVENVVGNAEFMAAQNSDGSFSYPGQYYIHSGTYAAFMGETGTLSTLSQSVATVPNRDYLLSFWLVNPSQFAGPRRPIPNQFNVAWNGDLLFDRSNMRTFSYTNMQFVVAATNTTSVVTFGFRNDIDYFGLDDVTATLIPVPAFQSASWNGGAIVLSWSATSNVTYQLQYSTTLSPPAWVNLGASITAAGNTISTSDSQPTDPGRFYRVIIVSH